MTTTEYSVNVFEAKSSIKAFLDPKPYIRRANPHLTHSGKKEVVVTIFPG
jgi:hypothetical protein